MRTESEVVINRTAKDVFEHLIEPEKLKQWVDDFVSSTPASELSVDGPYTQIVRIGLSTETMHGKVVEFSKDRKFTFLISTRASQVRVSFELTPTDSGAHTKLVATEEITPLNFISKFFVPRFVSAMKQKQVADLKRLKHHLDIGGDKS